MLNPYGLAPFLNQFRDTQNQYDYLNPCLQIYQNATLKTLNTRAMRLWARCVLKRKSASVTSKFAFCINNILYAAGIIFFLHAMLLVCIYMAIYKHKQAARKKCG